MLTEVKLDKGRNRETVAVLDMTVTDVDKVMMGLMDKIGAQIGRNFLKDLG